MAFRNPRKKETRTKNAAPPAEKKAGGAPGIAVMFALMLLVFITGAAMVIGYFKFLDPDRKEALAEEKEKRVAYSSMELGDMVVNLAGDNGNHFLKLTITIEYPQDRKTEEEILAKKHIITETILLTLRSKTIDQVRPPEAVDRLKNELVTAVNKRLGGDVISKIYFTEYIVS